MRKRIGAIFSRVEDANPSDSEERHQFTDKTGGCFAQIQKVLETVSRIVEDVS